MHVMKFPATFLFAASCLTAAAFPGDIRPEIKRAESFGKTAASLIVRQNFLPSWSADGSQLLYRINTAPQQHRFFQVDLKSGAKSPAFDHEALAQALTKASAHQASPDALPLVELESTPEPGIVRFRAFGKGWRYDSAKQLIAPDSHAGPIHQPARTRRGRPHAPAGTAARRTSPSKTEPVPKSKSSGVEGRSQRQSYGKIAPGQSRTQNTYSGHVWIMADAAGTPLAGVVAKDTPSYARVTGKVEPAPKKPESNLSPDGKWRPLIRGHNLFIEPAAGGETLALTTDGTAEDSYTGPIQWSPDSKKLSAWRVKKVESRKIHIVQSSPPDQLQPKLKTIDYPKPGDPIAQPKPRLFDIGSRRQIPIDDALFNNPWEISDTRLGSGFLGVFLRLQPARPSGDAHHRHPRRFRIGPPHP